MLSLIQTLLIPEMSTPTAAPSKSAQIRELLATGMAPKDIAEKVGCSTTLVSVVKHKLKSDKRAPAPRAKAAAPTSRATSIDGLSSILDAVKGAEQDRVRLRAALERIQTLVDDALAS